MPSPLAYLALFMWPIVMIVLFKRLPLRDALIWSIVGGYLLLPLRAGFNFPVIPTIDKTLIPSVMAVILAFAANRHAKTVLATFERRGGLAPRGGAMAPQPIDFKPVRGQAIFWGLLVVLCLAPLITAQTNAAPVLAGPRFIKGMSLYDAMSMISGLLVALIPFLLGRWFLASEEAHRTLLKVLVLAALGYSILIAYELRMSPQLNRMFYGFFPHSFAQHIRGDGFRPVVFLNHALWLAIFVSMAAIAAFAMWRTSEKSDPKKGKWLLAGLFLLGLLFLMKSLGAFLLAAVFIPLLLILGERGKLWLAAAFAALVLFYPMARGAGLVPINVVHSIAQSIDERRAASLQYRLDNEDILLEKANQKPLGGWGSWGRSRIYDERGKDISVTDGYWIIVIGDNGWLGYLAQFGLLCFPLIAFAIRSKTLAISRATTGLAIVMCVALIDLIPNATISPIVWLIAGSMMGMYQVSATRDGITEKASAKRTSTRDRENMPEAAFTQNRPRPVHRRQSRAAPSG